MKTLSVRGVRLDRMTNTPVLTLREEETPRRQIDIFIQDNFIVDKLKDSHNYEGAFIASFIRHLLIQQNKSFSFETVMSHTSKIDEIANTVKLGYKAYLYFVCIDSPTVNVSRVNNRVDKGGHEVPESKIIDRYYRTLNNLHLALPLCYRVYFFDNLTPLCSSSSNFLKYLNFSLNNSSLFKTGCIGITFVGSTGISLNF